MNWSIEFPSLHSDEGPARSCISFGHRGHVRGMSGAHEESHAPRVSSCFFLWTDKRSPDDFLTIDGCFFGFWTINRWWMSLFLGRSNVSCVVHKQLFIHCFTLRGLIVFLHQVWSYQPARVLCGKKTCFILRSWRILGVHLGKQCNGVMNSWIPRCRNSRKLILVHIIMISYYHAYVYIIDGYTEFKRWQSMILWSSWFLLVLHSLMSLETWYFIENTAFWVLKNFWHWLIHKGSLYWLVTIPKNKWVVSSPISGFDRCFW